jgi:hypothetical protein
MPRFKLTLTAPNAVQLAASLVPTPDQLLAFGNEQIRLIRARVAKGIGIMDLKMMGYADSTKKARKRKGLQISHRDLLFTGQMLQEMRAKVVGQGVTLSFGSARSSRVAGYNQKFSYWFGVSEADHKSLLVWLNQLPRR